MIRRALGVLGVVLVLVALFFAGVFAVSESGEVIVLTTYDAAGTPHQTRIWIADDAGAQWLRSGVRGNGWFQRLSAHPEVEVVADTEALIRSEIDVYAPCALGGALDDATVAALRASVVCGGANNQLVTEGEGGTADQLAARGITYAPDFLVNAGGVIQVSDELHGFDFERAKKAATAIFDHTLEVLETAQERSITPAAAADHIAEERMAAKQAGGIWLPAH